ncbi:MAG TPA: FecR domain-containing protein [Polyangia bacterium]
MKRPEGTGGDQKRDEGAWPRRWQHESHGLGSIMRGYLRRLDSGDDEAAAFARARAAVSRKSRQRWILASVFATMVTASAGWLLFAGRLPPEPSTVAHSAVQRPAPVATTQPRVVARAVSVREEPIAATESLDERLKARAAVSSGKTVREPLPTVARVRAPHASPRPAAVPAPPPVVVASRTRVLQLRAQPVALTHGLTSLGDATVDIGADSIASAWRLQRETAVKLVRGRIALEVQPRAPGQRFVVQAAPFDFVVVGTAFSVARSAGKVTLTVSEGRVAVERAGRSLALVDKDGSWAGALDEAPVTPDPRLDDEVALYEAARLARDKVGDLERARRGFVAYRDRFPHGTLRVEAALSLLELLPRLGRHEEALTESERLLAMPEAQGRRAEIHLLRGNLLRTALDDRRAALEEYRAAQQGAGWVQDEGVYAEALCLAELGLIPEAVAAFDRYLERPDARRPAEAQRRRDDLDPRRRDGAAHGR